MLLLFSQSTGLQVNYHKSALRPINIDQGHLQRLADAIGCKVGSLPFTYVGLPVGTTKPRIIDLMPLVDNMEIRLSASSSFLAQGAFAIFELSSVIGTYLLSLQFRCSSRDP